MPVPAEPVRKTLRLDERTREWMWDWVEERADVVVDDAEEVEEEEEEGKEEEEEEEEGTAAALVALQVLLGQAGEETRLPPLLLLPRGTAACTKGGVPLRTFLASGLLDCGGEKTVDEEEEEEEEGAAN